MDIDQALLTMRILCLNNQDNEDNPEASEIAEQFQAIDDWLSNGGYRPQAWQRRAGT